MVANYEIAKANGPLSLGYYGQMINIVCLRSICPNAACSRVADQRVKNEECANLPASLPFEETVFRRIANEASDPATIIDTASEFGTQYITIVGSTLTWHRPRTSFWEEGGKDI
jgi:hypothetical protein